MSVLFTPFKLKDVTLRNRIAVPPMCQYSATEGFTNDWHQVHYAGMARGGAGLVIVEATAVSSEGRITPHCLGLWNEAQTEGLARIAASIKAAGAVPGIQIAHAGRKASANRPWDGDDHLPEDDPRAWETIAPSPVAYGENLPRVPREMTFEDIARVTGDFAAAARRARDAGFEWLELHFAHGYLAQSFFSPHSNQRHDRYGGNLENRSRFPLETLAAVRDAWPEHLPLTARFGVIEYDGNDERTLAESIEGVRRMRAGGLDLLNVSINFVIPDTQIPWGTPALLAPLAEQVSRGAGVPVAVGWGVDEPMLAERVVAEKQVDLVMIGRAMLANPHYPYVLAQALKIDRPDGVLPAPYAHWLESYHGAGKLSS
ncbi:NADH:flavin oxidoreductase/NADH oxidase [Lonsdalea quercina]|uniref:NADH:flavin oxidoreductase/NADH oxidase n=1 Tax=Lonsdalea quercina TaxID=71657 RepID=UPI0039760C9B